MSCAYSSRNLTFPLSRLQTLLLYKTHEQAESDCKRYGILEKDNAVIFNKATFQPNAHVSSVTTPTSETSSKLTYEHTVSLPDLFVHDVHPLIFRQVHDEVAKMHLSALPYLSICLSVSPSVHI